MRTLYTYAQGIWKTYIFSQGTRNRNTKQVTSHNPLGTSCCSYFSKLRTCCRQVSEGQNIQAGRLGQNTINNHKHFIQASVSCDDRVLAEKIRQHNGHACPCSRLTLAGPMENRPSHQGPICGRQHDSRI